MKLAELSILAARIAVPSLASRINLAGDSRNRADARTAVKAMVVGGQETGSGAVYHALRHKTTEEVEPKASEGSKRAVMR